MQTIEQGSVHVLTFREGVLSRVGHDLSLRLTRFSVHIEGRQIKASFWPAGLEVEGALRDGSLDPGALSASDRADILATVRDKILLTDRHPEIRFEGTADADAAPCTVRGTLTLRGQSHPIEVSVRNESGRLAGELDLRPSRWGIAPYKAMLGALRVQDRVRVEFALDHK